MIIKTFPSLLILSSSQCVIDGSYRRSTDTCIVNPVNCNDGLSFSVWEKMEHPMDIIIDPNSASFTKKYLISTGGDYEISADGSTGRSVPGMAIYHLGLDLVAVVSTGDDVWELKVDTTLNNNTNP